MGMLISTPAAHTEKESPASLTKETLPTQEPDHRPYYGLPVPPEASMTRNDSFTWYTEFFHHAQCLPHRDGNHIIVRWPKLSRGEMYNEGREMTGWPVIKMRKVYERMDQHHPRIVRYAGALDDGSIVVERLWPGPFDITLPTMTVPFPSQPSKKDKMLLSLYYRWALQGLSALGALHSRGIHMRTLDTSNIWLRPDYSLAVTGFIGAVIPDDDADYGDSGGGVYAGDNQFDEDGLNPGVEEDLFYWATFAWRLMTNDFSDAPPSAGTYCWEPYCPPEGGCPPCEDNIEASSERWMKKMWQKLEDARLGEVFVKAWNKRYTSAEEVADEIRANASKMDIVVIGADEVQVDGKWEDVFIVTETGPRPRARRLEFRESEKSVEVDS